MKFINRIIVYLISGLCFDQTWSCKKEKPIPTPIKKYWFKNYIAYFYKKGTNPQMDIVQHGANKYLPYQSLLEFKKYFPKRYKETLKP